MSKTKASESVSGCEQLLITKISIHENFLPLQMLSRAGSPCLLSTEVRVTMLLCCHHLQPLPSLQLRAPSPSDKFTKLTPTSRGLSTNSEHCANIYNEIEIVQSLGI